MTPEEIAELTNPLAYEPEMLLPASGMNQLSGGLDQFEETKTGGDSLHEMWDNGQETEEPTFLDIQSFTTDVIR